ncbi:MAG: metalloprotease [archaeon]
MPRKLEVFGHRKLQNSKQFSCAPKLEQVNLKRPHLKSEWFQFMDMRFSQKEIKDLFFAWIIISLAFAILFSGGLNFFSSINKFIITLGISAFTVGVGFLAHELMHKYYAQKYRCWAEFRAFYNMLWLALVFSLFGFIFAAPGAVVIRGYLNKRQNGIISLAGPATNIVLAVIFLVPLFILRPEGILNLFFSYGLTINALLALFNMIPVAPFDGGKIYNWNKTIYTISILLALGLFILSFIL